MGGATLLVFAAVAHRYLAGVAIPGLQDWLLTLDFGWAQELTIILFVWMAKFGAAYGVLTGIHVGVDVLIHRLPARTRGRFIVFGLLAGLMRTGMPVSIALGLTVLLFLFAVTQVPLESVAIKLFTGIEKFEIMAIPFFILAGNFLTHGGVARRMIDFATAMVGHLRGSLGLSAVFVYRDLTLRDVPKVLRNSTRRT